MIATTKMRSMEAAEYLRIAPSTLAKLRCYGGGPRFSKAGKRIVIYERRDLDRWLQADHPPSGTTVENGRDCN